ncbi:MAG: DUF2860 family protein [Deltaproteobacteria bacterium]|nr:MAG: DUF2860 family protein [Deltaproteobacteria bacterium]
MRLMSLFTKVIIIVSLCVFASTVHAQPYARIPQESGFSGFVSGGAGVWRVENNMVKKIGGFTVSDDEIGSLDNKPHSETEVTPIFNYNLNYTFASTRTQIFLGSELENILRMDPSTLLGVRQELPDQSVLGVAYVFSPFVSEVYRDPYVEDRSRDGTDRTINGLRLSYANILASDFSFQYTYRNIDINNERSGRQLETNGVITGSEKDRLDRNGDQHDLEVLYRFVSESGGSKHTFIPSFQYSYFDLDGSDMTYNYFLFNLNYRYDTEKFAIALNGYYGYADYDESNPVFGKTREDDRYGFSVLGFYKHIFGVQGLHLHPLVTINRSDSNIDFYKSEVDLYALSLFYSF